MDRIWEELGLVKVYTKKRGAHPDLTDPICMRKGSTIEVIGLMSCTVRYRTQDHLRMSALASIGLLFPISDMHSFGELRNDLYAVSDPTAG